MKISLSLSYSAIERIAYLNDDSQKIRDRSIYTQVHSSCLLSRLCFLFRLLDDELSTVNFLDSQRPSAIANGNKIRRNYHAECRR